MKSLLFIVLLVIGSNLISAPFNGQIQQFKQPDGTLVDLKLFGDEYYLRAEGLDGYTLVRDLKTNWICYATLSSDKSNFVSSGIIYSGVVNNQLSLKSNLTFEKHLDISEQAIQQIIKKNRLALANDGLTIKNNQTYNQKISGTPIGNITGNIKGLCIVVDFSDEVGTLPMSEYESFCNDLNYSNYGNNGSLRKFYSDISGGLVDYQNVVYGYYRAPLTFAQYDAMPYAQGARQILGDALNWIKNQGFDFSTLSTNPDGSIQAINLMYTGTPPNWAQGMWFHKGNYTGFSANGVFSNDYNCSPAKSPLTLATVAHENGHMIGKWPDTYKYTTTTGDDGIGAFDLMCWYGSSTNPVPPNPLFRSNAGWGTVVDVTNFNGIVTDVSNTLTCYKYRNINDPDEFFLLENRFRNGRSNSIPDQGLTIWHIDRNGDNQTTHHEVWLEHANNVYTSESNACFKSGLNVEYNYSTTPTSNFYNGNPSGLRVWDISAATSTMTYKIGSGQSGPSLNLLYTSLSGDDNSNGYLEPSESALLSVDAFNLGQLSSASATISCVAIGTNSVYINVNTLPIDLGVINVNQTIPAVFNVSAFSNTPIGTEVELKFTLTDGPNFIYITKKIIIGNIINMSNQSENTCSAVFYDASGLSNYNDNTDYTKTFYPLNSGEMVSVNFLEFEVEDEPSCGYDYLKIYDGPSTSYPLVGMFCGTNSPGQVSSSNPSGALTFKFHSDGGLTMSGWKAIVSCNNVTGVKSNRLNVFSVSPNPSSGLFVLKFANEKANEISVVDVFGNEVFKDVSTSQNSYSLNLSEQANGIYFVKVKISDSVTTKKIVINR
jgi:M6 family metalloprotease-like protein